MAWTPQQLVNFSDAGDCYVEWGHLPGEDEGAVRLLLDGGLEGFEPLEAAEEVFARAQAWANKLMQPVVLQTYGMQRHGVKTFIPEPPPNEETLPIEWAMSQEKMSCAYCRARASALVTATSVYQGLSLVWQTTVYPSCSIHKERVEQTAQSNWIAPFEVSEGIGFATLRVESARKTDK